ncbi:MAG: class I SAM-dependent methyltransferase [Blautia sp.]|nr:class I SAM-dependent methyltransferase [Blautia sp.]
MEDQYQEFASVYDLFMDNVDYEGWAEYLVGILSQAGIRDGLILDLGCGTGTMTELLAQAGYDMIGVDSSAQMLSEALSKRERTGSSILYLEQQMQDFELYGTVRGIVSVCDSLNYILSEAELLHVFSLVDNYLDPGGFFIFDMNTPRAYEEIADQTIAENRDDSSFIWENAYDSSTRINECLLTLFIREKDERCSAGKPFFTRTQEYHVQKAYELEEVCRLLKEARLQVLGVYDAYTDLPATDSSKRVSYIAREMTKSLQEKE